MVLGLFAGCGYTLQNSKKAVLNREGITKIYVSPLANNTFKPGVENLVYNELIKALASHGRVTVVHREEEADATLTGTVSDASYSVTAGTDSNSIFPSTRTAAIEITIATEYQATMSCNFTLERLARSSRPPGKVWNSSFVRTKKFPGNNQKDEFGTTSSLINESEFDRALHDIAASMMGDVHESMLAMF